MVEVNDQTEIISFATFGTIMSILTLAAVICNIRCFTMTYRFVKSKPSLILVLNLSIADTSVAVVSLTAFMVQHILTLRGYTDFMLVNKLFWSTLIGLGIVTIITLTGLAGDCFIALRWPLHYGRVTTVKAVRIYIGTTWLISAACAVLDFLVAAVKSKDSGSYMNSLHDSMVLDTQENNVKDILTASMTMLVSNTLSLLCLVALIVIYSYVIAKVYKIKHNLYLVKYGGFRNELFAVRKTFMVFSSFLLLWAPTLIINILTASTPDFMSKLNFVEVSFIGYTADCLLMIHAIVDALIYGARVKNTIIRQKRSKLNLQDYQQKRRATILSSTLSTNSAASTGRHGSMEGHSKKTHQSVFSINGDNMGVELTIKDENAISLLAIHKGDQNHLRFKMDDSDSLDEGVYIECDSSNSSSEVQQTCFNDSYGTECVRGHFYAIEHPIRYDQSDITNDELQTLRAHRLQAGQSVHTISEITKEVNVTPSDNQLHNNTPLNVYFTNCLCKIEFENKITACTKL